MTDETEKPAATTLSEVRKEITAKGEAFRENFEGDLCGGKHETVSNFVEAAGEPFVKGFSEEMGRLGINTPEDAAAAVQIDPSLRQHANFASATLNAITQDAATRRTAAFDKTFQELCPTAYGRDGKLLPETSETAVEYLKAKGWTQEQIEKEWHYGELRHPAEQVKAFAASKQWKTEQAEIKKLDAAYARGDMTLREASRRRVLRGK